MTENTALPTTISMFQFPRAGKVIARETIAKSIGHAFQFPRAGKVIELMKGWAKKQEASFNSLERVR